MRYDRIIRNRTFFVFLSLLFIMMLLHKSEIEYVYAREEINSLGDIIYYASTAEELNECLGGNHVVKKNTVILQENVILADTQIVIDNTVKRITLDANGKKITAVPKHDMAPTIILEDSNLRIIGDGEFEISGSGGSWTCFIDTGVNSILTIESGTFISKGKLSFIRGSQSFKKKPSQIYIKGGDLTKAKLFFEDMVPVSIHVSGGETGSIELSEVCIFRNANPEYERNKLTITGGVVQNIQVLDYARVILDGGTIGEGGIAGACYHLDVKKGEVIGSVEEFVGDGHHDEGIRISGGTLSDVSWAGTMIMKGGSIQSSKKDFALRLWGEANARISGGTILSKKKNGTAVLMEESSKLTVTGGTITSSKQNGKYGMYLAGAVRKNGKVVSVSTLVFKGVTASNVLSGFKKPVYCVKDAGKVKEK